MMELTCSLVTFNNAEDQIKRLIDCFEEFSLDFQILIFDNSEFALFAHLANENIIYFHSPVNVGFGAGHNYGIEYFAGRSKYHLIINPDIFFKSGVLEELLNFMDENKGVSIVAPKILYPNGTIQNSFRLLPSFFDLILRRVAPLRKMFAKREHKNYLKDYQFDKPLAVNFILGCFLLCRTSILKEINGFDERFFLYMEDFDLVRRMSESHRVYLYPHVSVIHEYDRGATKKVKLLILLFKSVIQYYNKWGWFDERRKVLNQKVLQQIKPERFF